MTIQTTLRRAIAAATILTAGAASAETVSYAHFVPPQHTLTEANIEPLQEAVADSGLEIQVYPGGELGAGPTEQYVRVIQGVADIGWGLPGYTSSQFDKTMISELPGVGGGDRSGYEILWDAWDAGLLQDEFPRAKPLALWLSEPNVFIMKDKDIRTPADVEGLKIRVSGSAAGQLVEALGGTPVQMPASEMYNALQTGLIDGIITGASAISDFRLDEVANSYTTGPNLGHISFFVVMNQSKYDGLPEEQRAAIDSIAGRELSRLSEEGWYAKADETLQSIKGAGDNTVIELGEEESAAFSDITEPVTQRIVEERGAEEVYNVMTGQQG
ncbi:TRAP-type C4-dicarboxylate transport system, substrate-binding protein [Palleronia marisminoris]|uniref:C4-dicarboxylate-binding periplasmic protein n=1 Tax=Palleronia marisminoris TaxID=315423 RepID=A0A1Y5TQQ1_9RHOB|nr:TRAP transporter substrate-binding protein [Palleronia marisminoris]SFH41613.1 TRAP-type C4-dicarboxylate transport system, substrate-binding protein [Palleronia marisminoris]SLN65914.1 C4-dicarboxylate-binding periplasmic protein precursor [Palleronia marisminoris]